MITDYYYTKIESNLPDMDNVLAGREMIKFEPLEMHSENGKDKQMIFWADMKENTEYVFSFRAKATTLSDISVSLIDSASGTTIRTTRVLAESLVSRHWDTRIASDPRLMPSAYDNEWHRRSVVLHSGGQNKIGIMVTGSYGEMYLDSFFLGPLALIT